MTRPTDSSNPDVSVIIVNFNGLRFLDECINSIKNAFIKYETEIIVVDNDSTDSSQQWLRDREDIIYIESKVNTGFTGGNNLGATYAKGDKLLFINNDTKVVNSLDPLIDLLDRPEVGISACRLQYGDQRQQYSIGYEHTPLRIALSWLGTEKYYQLPTIFRRLETSASTYLNSQNNVNWVSGACFAIRRTDWQKLGGFDTDFFMYCEDVDLCRRIRNLGYSIAYTSESLVTHYEGAGKAWIGSAALKRTAQSYQIFTRKHFGNTQAAALSYVLGFIFGARAIAYALLKVAKKTNEKIYQEKYLGFKDAAKILISYRASQKQNSAHV